MNDDIDKVLQQIDDVLAERAQQQYHDAMDAVRLALDTETAQQERWLNPRSAYTEWGLLRERLLNAQQAPAPGHEHPWDRGHGTWYYWDGREEVALINVHHSSRCADSDVCVIHNPSPHHLRHWPMHWRPDRKIFERMCPHGIGHPDPDCWQDGGVHGCDGCCARPQED